MMKFKNTKEIRISKNLVDQVIGQEHAIDIIKKAAKQRRNVLLIGQPGTGKSMIGQALAELLPKEKLHDVLSYHNPSDDNVPLIKVVPRGEGKKTVSMSKLQAVGSFRNQNIIFFVLILLATFIPYYFYSKKMFPFDSPIVYAASMITSMIFLIGFVVFMNLNRRMSANRSSQQVPYLLIDNASKAKAPFVDATGAHAGALLGDVLHDPLQTFSPLTSSYLNGRELGIKEIVNKILKENQNIKKGKYIAAHTKPDKYFTIGYNQKINNNVEILSANKYKYKGNLIRVVSSSGKELIVTPEHKVAIKSFFNKLKYTRADSLKPWHKLVTLE